MSTELSLDPKFDKQAVFQLLAKFDLSAGDLADVFASYLAIRPAKDVDLESLRGALKKRGTASQIEVLKATGRLLTSEEIGERLGLASRQSVHNLKLKGICSPSHLTIVAEITFRSFNWTALACATGFPKSSNVFPTVGRPWRS
jgi:hypothetical protein